MQLGNYWNASRTNRIAVTMRKVQGECVCTYYVHVCAECVCMHVCMSKCERECMESVGESVHEVSGGGGHSHTLSSFRKRRPLIWVLFCHSPTSRWL